MKKFSRILATILLFFVAFGALYGGWILIFDPSGGGFGWSPDLLEPTPFDTFLIPGIILFVSIGLFGALVGMMTILKKAYYAWLVVLYGCILLVWLTTELVMNSDFFVAALHYPLYIIGVLFVILGFFLKRKHV